MRPPADGEPSDEFRRPPRSHRHAGHRHVPFSATVDGDDLGPLAPHVTGGSFLNFLKDTSRTRDASMPADLARLQELKRACDPDDRFGVGHRIGPAPAEVVLAA